MAPYIDDRAYTNYIHENVALPKIYSLINWQKVNLEQAYAEEIDMQQGIDYVFRDTTGQLKTVQERFRESKYYKMKADYFTYGITNCLKFNINQCTDFIKYAVIDLRKVYEKIDNGLIIIRDNQKNTCEVIDNKIICPVKYNHDGFSSFFPIEIAYLVKLWGNGIIIAQKGFL